MFVFERQAQNELRYPYLSPSELKARLDKKAILYFPMGSLEWHNEHLPLGTDTLHAIQLCHRLCERVGGVALPAFWWDTGGCHDAFCTYHIPEAIYRQTLKNVLTGLKPIPAKLLVLVNGHGGGFQKDSPPIVADELNRDGFPMRVLAADPYDLARNAKCRIDHADTGETSVAMDLIPELVRMDRPIGPDLFSGKPPFLVRGQPSAEFGRTLTDAFLAEATQLIERVYAETTK